MPKHHPLDQTGFDWQNAKKIVTGFECDPEKPQTGCVCEKPGMCERHGIVKHQRLWELCRCDRNYFAAWEKGEGILQNVEWMKEKTRRLKEKHAKEEQNGEHLQGGPGTELLKLLDKPIKILGFLFRIDLSKCDCRRYARQMDEWGVVGCRRRILEIVDHLQRQAKRQRMLFNRRVARILIRRAIRRAEKKERLVSAK